MASDVEIKVKATGASAAAGDIKRVNDALDDTGRSGRDAARGFDRVGEGADTADTRAMGFRDTITGVQDLNRGLTGDFDSLGDQLFMIGTGFGDLASGLANFGVQFAQQAATFIANTARMVATHVTAVATTIAGWVAQGVAALAAGAQMALAWLIGLGPIALVILAVGAIIAILVALGVGFDDIKKVAETVWNFILGAIKAVWNWVSKNWPLLLAILTGPIGLAVLVITRNWETIKNGFTAVKDWISNRVSDIVGFITGLPSRISRAASGMFGGITEAFKSAINALIDLWNNFSITFGGYDIPGPGPNIPSFTIDTPNIPHLARGGLGTGLIMAGERGRELIDLGAAGGRVMSNADTENALGSGGSVINVTVYVQGSVVTERELVGVLTQELRTKGVVLA